MTVYSSPFPGGSDGKESAGNGKGDLGSIPELGRSPGEGNGYPLQYSVLENSMDCTIHGVTKSNVYLCVSVHSVNVSTALQINVLFQSSCPSWYGSAA